MATRHSNVIPLTIVPMNIEVVRHWCATSYIGTKEDLIAEGLATEDMFAIPPKRIKSHLGPDIPMLKPITLSA